MNRFVLTRSWPVPHRVVQMGLMNIQDFLRPHRSLEPVSFHEEQLFRDWGVNAVPQDESASVRRVDRHALVGKQMVVDGEQEVSMRRGAIQMQPEVPFLVVFSGAHGGSDSAVGPAVPAVEAHLHEEFMGDHDWPLETPPQPSPQRAVFVVVYLEEIRQTSLLIIRKGHRTGGENERFLESIEFLPV